MPIMMKSFPNLPLLSMRQSLEVLTKAKVPQVILPVLTGFTRMQFYRWRLDSHVKPHSASVEIVSALAYRVLRAAVNGKLPKPSKNADYKLWAEVIDDDSYPQPLSKARPIDLLPPKWYAAFYQTQRHSNATEAVS